MANKHHNMPHFQKRRSLPPEPHAACCPLINGGFSTNGPRHATYGQRHPTATDRPSIALSNFSPKFVNSSTVPLQFLLPHASIPRRSPPQPPSTTQVCSFLAATLISNNISSSVKVSQEWSGERIPRSHRQVFARSLASPAGPDLGGAKDTTLFITLARGEGRRRGLFFCNFVSAAGNWNKGRINDSGVECG